MRHCVAQLASSVHYSPIKHKGCQQIQESLSRSANLKDGKKKTLANREMSVKKCPCCDGCAAAMWKSNRTKSGPRAPLATSPKWTLSPNGTMLRQVERQSHSPRTAHRVQQRFCIWNNNTELCLNSTCEIDISISVKLRTYCGSKLANVTTELAAKANRDYGYMKKLAFKEWRK